jgi:CDP-diglyceride synthetase
MKQRVLQTGSLFGAAGSALSSAAAAICCIGPIGITLLGVQGAIFAAGLKPYRWYLLGASALFLALAFWLMPRPVTSGPHCSVRTGRLSRIVLWTSTAIWSLAVVLQFAADWFWL